MNLNELQCMHQQSKSSSPSSSQKYRKIQLQLKLEHGISISKPPDDWPTEWVFSIGYYI